MGFSVLVMLRLFYQLRLSPDECDLHFLPAFINFFFFCCCLFFLNTVEVLSSSPTTRKAAFPKAFFYFLDSGSQQASSAMGTQRDKTSLGFLLPSAQLCGVWAGWVLADQLWLSLLGRKVVRRSLVLAYLAVGGCLQMPLEGRAAGVD